MTSNTGQYYKAHPETGEPGNWRLFPDAGWVNFDQNAPEDVYWNKRNQNYLGELGQYYWVNPNTGEESIRIDPDGNERPGWYYSGQLGWLNTRPADIQPIQQVGSPKIGGGYVTQEDYDARNTTSANTPPPATTTTPPPATTVDSTPPVVPRTGMLNPEQNSWLQVLNRQGADLESWDPYLGMFTNRENNIDWSQLDSNQVQSSFESLAGEGLFPSLTQNSIYSDLLKRLGYA
jgi:hypothetical protein